MVPTKLLEPIQHLVMNRFRPLTIDFTCNENHAFPSMRKLFQWSRGFRDEVGICQFSLPRSEV